MLADVAQRIEQSRPKGEVVSSIITIGTYEPARSGKIYPNVDPANPDAFLPILKQGVAHAKGTVFPGMQGNIYLFAHSADNWWDVGRYNAVFYLLKDLQKGDEVVIFFENVRYEYVVTET